MSTHLVHPLLAPRDIHMLSLLMLLVSPLFIEESDDVAATFKTSFRGVYYDFKLGKSQLERTPVWDSGEEYPPYPAAKALEAARAYLKQIVDDAEKWRVECIWLEQPIRKEKRWVYVVLFRAPSPKPGRPGDRSKIIVLMNGEVLKASPRQDNREVTKPKRSWLLKWFY